jgi:hypothetical protein
MGTGDNELFAVVATGANDVWAVGFYTDNGTQRTLTEHWNGVSWTVIPSPNVGTGHNRLYGVAALAANDAWAVGSYNDGSVTRTLTLHWNGTAWTVIPSPSPGQSDSFLRAVTAVGANDVWAVGTYNSGSYQSLVEHWNGAGWTVIPSPNAGTRDNQLYGLTALGANDIWAVGRRYDSGWIRTLTEHWDGASWRLVTSANQGSDDNYLLGVAAGGANDIWAVGQYDSGNETWHTLVAHYPTACPTPTPLPCAYLLDEGFETGTFGAFTTGGDRPWWIDGPGSAHEGLFQAGVSFIGPTPPAGAARITSLPTPRSGAVGRGGPPPTVPPARSGPPGPDAARPADGVYGWLHAFTPIAIPTQAGWADLSFWYRTYGQTGCWSSAVISTDSGATWSDIYYLQCNTVQTATVDLLPYRGQAVLLGFAAHYCCGYGGYTSVALDSIRASYYAPGCTPIPPAPTPHAGRFQDVPPLGPFYPYIECMGGRGIISGYDCGQVPFEPCYPPANKPYFRPGGALTRGQAAKIIGLAAGWNEPVLSTQQTFADMPPPHPFWPYVERMAARAVISGYSCGSPGEPCDPQNRPYFRPGVSITRGQMAKLDANAAAYQDPIPPTQQTFADIPPSQPFWVFIERMAGRGILSGYACGGPGEPCDSQNRPYYRPGNEVTRGQTSKIVTNTFFPNCQDPTPTPTRVPTAPPTPTGVPATPTATPTPAVASPTPTP